MPKGPLNRRSFLKTAAGAMGAAAQASAWTTGSSEESPEQPGSGHQRKKKLMQNRRVSAVLSRAAVGDDLVSCWAGWPQGVLVSEVEGSCVTGRFQLAEQGLSTGLCISFDLGAGGRWTLGGARSGVAHSASL